MNPALRRSLSWAGFLGLLAAVVLYAAGAFRHGRVEPGRAAEPASPPAPARTSTAERTTVDVVEEAVGTVHSRRRVVLAAQVPARIVAVRPQVGDVVKSGEILAELDGRELAAALGAARNALAAAEASHRRAVESRVQGEARLTLAQSRHDRVSGFAAKGAATAEMLEAAQAELAQAKAAVAEAEAAIAAAAAGAAQARQGVTAAEVAFGHATIAAPFDGVVVERSVEPGELAWPGRALLVVLDPAALRLDAIVRESLASLLAPGAVVDVDLPSAGVRVSGRVAEVAPAADPRTRTLEVRIALPATPRVVPGMFGRLRLPVGRREVVRVDASAVAHVGQLETVLVKEGDRWARRLVATGGDLGDGAVEVLAGLVGGETVGLPPAALR
jgi:HlyD family secretion protein